ncbi:sulfur oxidation c-type cytochrome SoxA [Magnetospira thiophila]
MGHFKMGLLSVLTGFVLVNASAQAGPFDNIMDDPRVKDHIVGDKRSGYVYSTVETRNMQEDDFENPSFQWVEEAEVNWSKPNGSVGKSCADCHGDVSSFKGLSVTYPIYYEKTKKMAALQHRVSECLTERMGAKNWKWESDQMLGMIALIKLQSRGMPLNVSIDGPAKPFFEKGREFYFQRRGQMDLACSMCHMDNPGNMIRAEILSYGMVNGFPTYRLKWQKLGSLHRRFKGCNDNIRAEPYERGSEEYTNLELFTAWRSNDLPSEAPSVRK